jgi:DNA repair photolyase
MAEPILAKTLLAPVKNDPWFGLSYNMNLYRGCQHGCIYCDSRSSCYQLGELTHIRFKKNAIELLTAELPRKRKKGTIGTGSMNDPYMPVEKELRLTRSAMEIIERHKFPVHIITKSTSG